MMLSEVHNCNSCKHNKDGECVNVSLLERLGVAGPTSFFVDAEFCCNLWAWTNPATVAINLLKQRGIELTETQEKNLRALERYCDEEIGAKEREVTCT